jgi:predicted O-linked N-acetylglucosamine transferase (SPINDLY family)
MTAVPTARLLLFNTAIDAESERYIQGQLNDRGVDLARVEIRRETHESTYLQTYNEIDMGLDVFPWSGGTTTREALWMGVVVIGLYGNRRSARGTSAALSQAGLDELIARTPADYVKLTCELAGNRTRLQALRATMRQRMADTVCNAERFTRALEAAYREMWQRWCSNQ